MEQRRANMSNAFHCLADDLQAQQREFKRSAETVSYLEQKLRQSTRRDVIPDVRHVDVSAYVRYAARHNFLTYLADNSSCPDAASLSELNRRLRLEFQHQRSRKASMLAELDEVSKQTAAASLECQSICAALEERLKGYRAALPGQAVQLDALEAQMAAANNRLEESTQLEAFSDLELKAVQHEINSLERDIVQEQADADECNWQLKRLQQQLQDLDGNMLRSRASGDEIPAVRSKTLTSFSAFGDLLHLLGATAGSDDELQG